MSQQDAPRGGLRAVTRDVVRQRLSDVAIDLFAERGFEGVTVEQVAAAAGVSTRSVHRYFPAKEDMVVGTLTDYGERVAEAFAARTTDERAIKSLHAAYSTMLGTRAQTDRDKIAIRLLSSTPSLRARNFEKHLQWAELLTPVVAHRLNGDHALIRAKVIVQASLCAFDVALATWAETDEMQGLQEILSTTFGALES
ncbi:TetR family transcriptional regulator [Arthrobacter sp. ISL-95]|uniref:TetR family transcriptional regulator n=1 Tax=Arthrobacter sp. ISL-95 TaxID=2819116 RepID=UPI001BE98735|nr:TetR family transcriptional regulator [Arthrobacter sp. ISL-95]MBT2585398.1 TetR family transcriptional regulator [Arthrobacter sp. ISL-95]